MNINILRLIAITLPMMLLIACGGGGGGGGTATTRTPTTTPDPVTLPGYAITDLAVARRAVGGTAPTSMTESQIVSEIQTRATAADYFAFSDFSGIADADTVSVTCNASCSADVSNVGMLTFSLDGIADLSLVNDEGLMDFDSESQAVMITQATLPAERVTMIQSQTFARQSDETELTFQTYGGWLDDSVFGVEFLNVTENSTTTNRVASFSFGERSGSRPTGEILVQYHGVLVGSTSAGDVIQGSVFVQYVTSGASILDQIIFRNIRNLNNGNAINFGDRNDIEELPFHSIPLAMDGSFESVSGDIKGNFYGDNHSQIGGVFNSSTNNIMGAFGGVRERD